MSRISHQMLTNCPICQKHFYVNILHLLRNKKKIKCCSRLCYYASITINTKTNPGIYLKKDQDRYYVYWRENGKRIIKPKAVWVWEMNYGLVSEGFQVHHKNEDKKDDEIKNLELMPIGEHQAYHNFCKGLEEIISEMKEDE